MRNRCKTLLRDHSVLEVILQACLKHIQSQPYLRPSPLKDLKDLPTCAKNFSKSLEQEVNPLTNCWRAWTSTSNILNTVGHTVSDLIKTVMLCSDQSCNKEQTLATHTPVPVDTSTSNLTEWKLPLGSSSGTTQTWTTPTRPRKATNGCITVANSRTQTRCI